MNLTDSALAAIERTKVLQPVGDWALWRDMEQWDRLRAVYAPGATMAVSWFDGLASEFVARCQKMNETTANPMVSQHLLGGSQVQLRGARALVETRVSILMRLAVHGVECDVTAIGRFHDWLIRPDEAWLIDRRVAIFEKDMMQGAVPGESLDVDRAKFLGFPAAYRCCAYALAERGMTINASLPAPGSSALAALYAAGQDWLAAGPSAAP